MSLEVIYTPEQLRRLRPLEGRTAGTLLVHEIYASVQGESTYAGLPCSFVRLTACHLRCRWCDSAHAFAGGTEMTLEQVVQKVACLTPRMVELTGGEPLLQPEAFPLMAALADAGLKVLVETSGSIPIDRVDPRVTIILDLKCPSSGEVDANCYQTLPFLKPGDEVKFVVGDRHDFQWVLDRIREHDLLRYPVLIAPVFGEVPYTELCGWILESGLPLRFQPQMHKHIWDPNARGV